MSLYGTLFPYQKNIVDNVKDKRRYGLFLDMGLGKTLVSLALAEVNNCTKVIVVSINAKAEETEDEKGSWLWWAKKSDIKYNLWTKKILKPTKKRPNTFTNETNDILLLNFESLYSREKSERGGIELRKEIRDFISTFKGHNVAIIVDESHKLKTYTSLATKSVEQMLRLSLLQSPNTRLYLGTGTPFTKGFIDLYSQLKLLGWTGTKTYFKDTFCIMGNIGGLQGWQQPIVGYKNTDLLFKLLHTYAITIKSEEVADLPEKIFVEHTQDESLDFMFLTMHKMKMAVLNKRLAENGLPIIMPASEYDKLALVDKEAYWSKLQTENVNGIWTMCGGIELGSIDDKFEDLSYALTELYKMNDEYEALAFLRAYWYMFRESHLANGTTKIEYYKYKGDKLVNNPFYSNLMFPNNKWTAETSAARWMRARQISAGFQGNAEGYVWFDYSRLNQLKNFLADNEDNYILFYNYEPEFCEIYTVCKELGYNIDIYNGTTKDTSNYDRFENEPLGIQLVDKKNIILSNYASGSTGKNWQAYNKCILFSTPTFDRYEQGLKRIHRSGQKKNCIYHKFYQKNFLEEGMLNALDNKGEYNEDMFEADVERINRIFEREQKEN